MANEKRLIDASVLIRDLTAMKSMYDAIALDGIIKALKEAPAVEAVEVVRCEKCLYCSQYCDENGLYKCGGIQNEHGECFLMVEPTHFCAFGKRRGKFGAKMDGGNEDG